MMMPVIIDNETNNQKSTRFWIYIFIGRIVMYNSSTLKFQRDFTINQGKQNQILGRSTSILVAIDV